MLKMCNLVRRNSGYWKPVSTNSLRLKYSYPYMNIVRNLPQLEISKIPNGLTVATQERESCNMCIGLYVNAGSRYESKEVNGITHFFEHIAFKSTKARTKAVLEKVILTTGVKFQCFTTRQMAGYFVECLSSDAPLVFDILLDCVFNNTLTYADVEAQKQIVFLEMLDHDKNYINILDDYLHLSAFQGTPLEQTVLGQTKNISTFNSQILCSLIYKRFTPKNMVLTAIGGIKHNQVLEIANKYLSKLVDIEHEEAEEYRYTGCDMRYRDDSLAMANVAIAFEGPSFCHKDYNVMKLATEVVGGWDKSQLGGLGHGTGVARAASYNGKCDSYKAFYIAYKDTALWGACFVASRLNLDDMVFALQDEYMNLCNMITDEQIERAKVQLKTKLLSKSESTVKTSHRVGRTLLYRGCYLSVFDAIQIIDNICTNEVKTVCHKYLYDKCPVVAAIGPTESLTDYSRIRSDTYWLRV